jgi:DNA-binding beta-propeller fold protein YncE
MARTPSSPSLLLLTVLGPLPLLALGCPAASGEDTGDTQASETTASETQASTETGSPTETGDTGETASETSDTDGDPPRPARIAVTADWRSKRLSLLDYAALRDGATSRDAALWKTIELPDHEPGPIEVELTPDGQLAVVAVGPGFFGGTAGALIGLAPGELPDEGALLVVDVDTSTILAEFETAQYPLGIVISADGTEAWTANYGGTGQSGTTLSRIDLGSLSIVEEYTVGPNPEQVDLSADGSLGIINTAGDGSVRVFSTADPNASLSPPLYVANDPSWVLFLEDGMDRAVSINSLGAPGYSLIDVADPAAPVVLDTVVVTGVAYAAAPGRTTNEILLSVYAGDTTTLEMFDVDTGEVVDQIEVPAPGFAMGIVFEPVDEIALVPLLGENALVVADFKTGDHQLIDWQTELGPTYVTLE